ncbi:MAG: hypothetical protein ACR2NA_00495 [Solirubrobacterales bacterium]
MADPHDIDPEHGAGRPDRADDVGGGLGAAARRLAENTSRRGFLSRVSKAMMATAGGTAVGAAVRSGEAEGYHFCGHIFTTDSCPHPTGLPRIDSRGRALRATDGAPVDDLGRRIDSRGRPLDEEGELLRDADGVPLAPTSRTPVCDAVADRYGFRTSVDGSWFRCCDGNVRRLVDCCARHPRRINGDRSLTGYCYSGRKVFCVLYYQTSVPC